MKQDLIHRLAYNVKKMRNDKNITQEELSFRSGLHKNYLSDVERGTRNISLKALEKLTKGLECEVEELFKEKSHN